MGNGLKTVRVIHTFTRITPYCIGAFRCFSFSRLPPAWHMTYTVNIISKGGENPATGPLERLHFEMQCLFCEFVSSLALCDGVEVSYVPASANKLNLRRLH